MKLAVTILALFVLALSVVPCCAQDSCNDSPEGTEQTDCSNQGAKDHNCPCSPFFSCGSCTGFVFVSNPKISESIVTAITSKVPGYCQNFTTDFFGKIWQPPKIG